MVWRKAAYPAGMKTIRQLTKDIFKRGVQAIEANKNYSPQRRKKAIELLGDQIFGAEFKSVKEFHAYRNQILVDELVYAQHVDIRRTFEPEDKKLEQVPSESLAQLYGLNFEYEDYAKICTDFPRSQKWWERKYNLLDDLPQPKK